MNNYILYFWIFVIGSFIGFIMESIWCIIKYKRLESRKGLIYGYFIPIYGIATVLLTLFIKVLNITNVISCYILTFFICFIIEYISSVFQEKCFNTKSWDYTNMKYNINGRVNIIYLIIWSFCGVLWYKFLNGLIIKYLYVLDSYSIFNKITIIFLIYILYDIIISVISSIRQKERRLGIGPRNKIEEWIDNKYTDEYMKKIYANAIFIE